MFVTHGTRFLRRLQLHPTVHLVFSGDTGLHMLGKSDLAVVDGTFDLCEEKLILTTIMGEHDGVVIPGAHLLSDSKEEINYKWYFEVL